MPDDGQLMGGFCTITSLRPAYVQLAESYVGLLDSPDVTPMMALETDEGAALFTSMSLGVASSCKESEAAFAFIKFLLDNERRLDKENSLRTDFVPVNRELSQKVLEAYLGEAGKEETEKLDQWCAQVSTPVFYDRSRELLDKLNDICGQYMNGLLSAEDCARQLQDMAFVYLNE